MGEPVRLMVDLPNEEQMVTLFAHVPGTKRVVASNDGRGFVVAEADAVAQTRTGKQVLNTDPLSRAAFCVAVGADDDTVAVVGENRKLLLFPLSELPEMTRGKGVLLQRYKDGGMVDLRTLKLGDGLSWAMGGGKTRTVVGEDLAEYVGKRASAGRMAPHGFPRDNRF
jgi:topoisomerase-4 subunit A